MTTPCPTCNKAVDPLRSRFAGVQGGKVVAYCSAECATSAQPARAPAGAPGAVLPAMGRSESQGVGTPAALPAGRGASPVGSTRMEAPSTGVPVLARTPASAVLEGPPRPITPAPGVPIDLDSGPVIEILRDPASGIVTSARDERSEPRAKHPDEIPIAEFWAADKHKSGPARTASDPGSAAVKLPKPGRDATADPSTTAAVTARSRTDRTLSEEDPDDQRDGDVGTPRKSRMSLVLLILLLLGAGGFLAYQYLAKHNVAAATKVLPEPAAPAAQASIIESSRPRPPPASDVAPAVGVVGGVDVAAAVEQARATLQADLTATSQRLSRIAAAALARTQDHAACDALAAQLGLGGTRDPSISAGPSGSAGSGAPSPVRQLETSDIAKLNIAYSLARGGDKRGSDALAAALGSQRADVRDEAARLLALLGDHRAVPHLTDLLAVSQRRLGAAEHLAHLAEPHAVKVLEALRGDVRASTDDKTRATIALGIAGHPDVVPALRDMLDDPHFNAFAAAALAELKDGAARPVLVHQLESPMLRVRAARALRRLDPALDPKPLLPQLLPILKTGRDTDQVQAAEAILLLAGPASWSAYD